VGRAGAAEVVEMSTRTREQIRHRLHTRIRKKIRGTPARPRLAVFRSQGQIYAQVIDDDAGNTLCAASSLDKDLRAKSKKGGNLAAAKEVGSLIAVRAREKGIAAVVFDRGGFLYHGRVKALAEAAREAGLKF
jgi:large subunit ribosomal protein L18